MWRDEHLLLDMLIYARRARDFNAKITWEQFQSDLMVQAATQYALQIIGEAASKVSRPYRDSHADIPWDRIIAFRAIAWSTIILASKCRRCGASCRITFLI